MKCARHDVHGGERTGGSPRHVYLGVMRAQAASGDVEGVAVLAERLDEELRDGGEA